MQRKLMKSVLINVLLSLVIALSFNACGGSSPSTTSHSGQEKIKPLVTSLYIHVDKHGDRYDPVNISVKQESGHTFTIIVSANGRLYLKGFRNGGEINCNRHTSALYCKNDTPFFSNVVGVRIKPGGAIVLDVDNLYDYLDDYKLYDDINAYNELNTFVVNKLKELDPYVVEQEKKYKAKKAKYAVVVNDKSGLYDNSIDFSRAVYIEYNHFPKASYTLPAYKIDTSKSFFDIEKKKFITAYPSIKKELYTTIAKLDDYVKISFSEPYSEKYAYKVHPLEKAYFNKSNRILVDILTANIKLHYPVLSMKDKILSISEGKDNTVRFQNNSNEFLSIKSISYYLNKDIVTDTDFDRNSILEIPPQSYIELSKDVPENKFENQLYFEATTASKLKREKILYGLAVKYLSSKSNKVRTLYKTQKTSVYNLVK